ncbi:MAG: hypothetical protein ACJ77L_05590 [Solirubrobacteraceae bacterium]
MIAIVLVAWLITLVVIGGFCWMLVRLAAHADAEAERQRKSLRSAKAA